MKRRLCGLMALCLGLGGGPGWSKAVTQASVPPLSRPAALVPVQRQNIGVSGQQRPLEMVSFGSPQASSAVLLIFGQHGDELDGIQTGQYLLRDLQETALRSARWQTLLQNTRLDILWLMNPDGAAIDGIGQRENAAGVDLNRNWGYQWNASPQQPKRGPKPFSEPETQAVRDYIQNHPELKLVVDYHTGVSNFAQGMVHYPYTYASQDVLPAAEKSVLHTLAQQTAQYLTIPKDGRPPVLVLQVHAVKAHVEAGIRAQVPPAHQAQALASLPASFAAPGSTIDWVYGKLGIPALGIELSRPFHLDERPAFLAAFAGFYPRLSPHLQEAIAYWLALPPLSSQR
jgi:hypothetical protein